MTVQRLLTADGRWVARGYPDVVLSANRDDLVYGDYKPGPATAGILQGVARTDWNSPSVAGVVVFTAADLIGVPVVGGWQTVSNLNFYGDIDFRVSNVRFRNCRFYGGLGHPGYQLGCATLTGNGNHTDVEFYDCTFAPRSPSYYRDGIIGNNYRTYRCHAFHGCDGFGGYSHPSGAGDCNVEAWGCYGLDMVFWSQDPAHSDGTHNDIFQFQGGSHLRIVGCNFIGSSINAEGTVSPNPRGNYLNGQCVMVSQNTHQASDVLIAKNWLSHGSVQLNFSRGGYSTLDATLGDNRFGRDIWDQYPPNPDKRWIALGSSGYNIAGLYTAQRFDDNNALLTAGRTTGIRIL